MSPASWRPRFASVWLGQTASQLGSNMTGFALGVWVYQASSSVTQYALVLLSNTLPAVLCAPWAGALSDRFNRRTVMLVGDTVAGACTCALMLLFALGQLDLWHIYLINACNALARSCQWPAYVASVAQLAPADELGRANGLLQLSHGISQLVAPLLGGVLMGTVPMAGIFLVDMATFAIAVLTLAPFRFPDVPARAAARASWLRDNRDAWRALRTNKGLFVLTLLVVLGNFTAGSVEALVTPLVLSFASPAELGTLMTIGGLGMVGGSLGLGLWGSTRRLVLPLLASECVAGCAMILSGIEPDFVILAVAALLYFASVPVGTGCHHSLIQREIEPGMHGRIFAFLHASASAALILGYLGAGPLADHVFEPIMADQGALASSVGALIGTGEGRGIGLLFILMGVASLLAAAAAALLPSVRSFDAHGPNRPGAPRTC